MNNMNPYSPINKSTSKALYSFGRSSRPSMAKKTYCDTIYQIPSTMSHRKASIGYGKKIDWDDLNKSKKDIPPPNLYSPSDFVQINKAHKKGYTAGVGRQETKNKSFVQFDKSIPGPQAYTVQLKSEGPKYTLRPQTHSQTFVKSSSKIVPGPGCYTPSSSLNPQGKYFNSKWQSSRANKWNPSKSGRFSSSKSQIPGPGVYTPRNSTWDNNGNMTQSRYLSQGNRLFSTGNRSTIFEDQPKKFKNIPGPGMYDAFSDFGQIIEAPQSKTIKSSRVRPASSGYFKH